LKCSHYYNDLPRIKIHDREIPVNYYGVAQIRQLIENIPNEEHKLIALIQHDSACRASEAIRLRRDNIKYDEEGNLWLHTLAKGGKSRFLFVSKDTERRILQLLELDDREHLFLHSRSKNFEVQLRTTYRYYLRSLHTAVEKTVGITAFTTHDFRRNVAEEMNKAGYDIFTIQSYLGHKQISTTEMYIKARGMESMRIVRELRDGESGVK